MVNFRILKSFFPWIHPLDWDTPIQSEQAIGVLDALQTLITWKATPDYDLITIERPNNKIGLYDEPIITIASSKIPPYQEPAPVLVKMLYDYFQANKKTDEKTWFKIMQASKEFTIRTPKGHLRVLKNTPVFLNAKKNTIGAESGSILYVQEPNYVRYPSTWIYPDSPKTNFESFLTPHSIPGVHNYMQDIRRLQ